MAPGRLITIEGIDGAGKSTLASRLADALRDRGLEVDLLREPGGVEAAERIRDLVKDPALSIGPRAEALLYAAARAQLVDEAVVPLLERGHWVVLDRFVDSSLAYQGAGRDLGVEPVRAINAFATGGRAPDRTLLLDLELKLGRGRARGRAEEADRLEREHDEFFEVVRSAYLDLWRQNPFVIRRIDAAQPPERVLARAVEELSDLL